MRPAIRIGAIVAAVLIVAIGWYLGSPLFIRTTANEALPTAAVATAPPSATGSSTAAATTVVPPPEATARVIARGELQYVDALHNGKGPVSLLQLGSGPLLRFENVAITNAPDIHVYLSRETGGKWTESTSLYLGALKATNGSFNYDVPLGADLSAYRSVVVWCRVFSVLITWADLGPA